MGINNLPIITASTVQVSHVNDIILAMKGDFVGRNSATGAVQAYQSLGTQVIPWGDIYATGLNISGQPINFDFITTSPNRIVSGQTRTTSGQPDFIRADGTALTAVIEGAITDLVVVIEGTSVTVSTDISLTSLTAAPATNNTALVNEPSYAAEDYTKYAGEQKNILNIDAAASEWTSRAGEIIAYKVGASTEIAFGYLKSSTEIVNCYRGFFFDDNGDPLVRNTLSNNDTLTILSLGWVYADNSGTTGAVGYTTPIVSSVEPSSPATGDYWYDLVDNKWMIYSGAAYVDANRVLIGLVVNDTTSCIASRSFDFDEGFTNLIDIDLIVESATQVRTSNLKPAVNCYGTNFEYGYKPLVWDITTDRETGVSETADTVYYLYLTDDGEPKISDIFPYKRDDLKGFYHPYNNWRYAGRIFNDSSSDIIFTGNHEVKDENRFLISSIDITTPVSEVEFINLDYIPFQLIPNEKEILYLEFEVFNVDTSTASSSLLTQWSENNGAVYKTGGSDYYYYALPNTVSWTNASYVILSDSGYNNKNGLYKIHGTYEVDIASKTTKLEGYYENIGVAGTDNSQIFAKGYESGNGIDMNAFKVYVSVGNIDSGRMTLYGVLK